MTFNLKRIRRIMNKYRIVCPIRKANLYRIMMTKEYTIWPNRLKRELKQSQLGKVLLTGITYLFYEEGQKTYLSTIKDSSTHGIMAYHVSDHLTLDIVTDTLHKLKRNQKVKLAKDDFIHSDQGFHYTSLTVQKLVKKYKLEHPCPGEETVGITPRRNPSSSTLKIRG
ncbi:Integrase core domain-containing protein [Sporolactobacillus nakayamae]|uniref:Integrase core domain-containing protein n=1 Tax=Sporolactobacillus nakayamae TaxID=269670 RepID=A0A1I2VF23_9BACL|nr:Integrase core domain-containing protein [Sporolactobacillus nakayamae]